MNKFKNNLNSLWKGIKIGVNLPSLPKPVLLLHNHPITRVFRVLGGLSILLVLSKSEFALNYLFYIVFPLAFLHSILMTE